MDLSRILLAVPNIFGVSTHENKIALIKKHATLLNFMLSENFDSLRHSYNDIGFDVK